MQMFSRETLPQCFTRVTSEFCLLFIIVKSELLNVTKMIKTSDGLTLIH